MPSDFSTAFAAEFADAAGDAGFLVVAIVRPKDCAARPFELACAFEQPDRVDMLTGRQSKEYEIEFAHVDAPDMVEGDEVEIDEVVYTVRRPPFVHDGGVGGIDGTYRRAVLTRRADDCGA
jgi:hypothetical protein